MTRRRAPTWRFRCQRPDVRRIRIAIADDHALFRQGLKALLRGHDETVVVAEADRVDGLPALVAGISCDVVLLDLQMERSALTVIEPLAALASVVVVTANEYSDEPLAAMRAGARAVVFKRFAVETLMDAIRAVVASKPSGAVTRPVVM